MELKCKANGTNFHVQLRSLNCREIDARAEAPQTIRDMRTFQDIFVA
jgi:hypothetical protein